MVDKSTTNRRVQEALAGEHRTDDRVLVGFSFRTPFQATNYRCETEGAGRGRAFFGRLLGMSRLGTLMGITLGNVLGCVLVYF